jgi:hypothetical protein
MASTFTSYVAKNVGTSASTVVTVAAATTATVIGLSVANTTGSSISVDIYITRSATDYYLVKGAFINVGSTFIASGGDEKMVLIAGDALKVVSSAATSADVIASVLNLT